MALEKIYNDAVIFSVDCAELTEVENESRRDRLAYAASFLGILTKEVYGHFDGKREKSFVVSGEKNVNAAIFLARAFQQNSVLLLASPEMSGPRQSALLDLVDLDIAPLGWFKNVGGEMPGGDWTYDPTTKDFYTVTPFRAKG